MLDFREADGTDDASVAEAQTPPTVCQRLCGMQFNVQEAEQTLLRARFHVGDAVVYPRYGQGVVQKVWVEGDGTIWVRVQRDGREGNHDFHSFAVHENCLQQVKV